MAESSTDHSSTLVEKAPRQRPSRIVMMLLVGCVIVGLGVIGVVGKLRSVSPAIATPTAMPTVVPTEVPIQVQLKPERCVAIAGDSVAYGVVLFGVPTGEVAITRLRPLSFYLTRSLAQAGLNDVEVRDRSLSAIVLGTSPKGPSFFETTQYKSVLADHCTVTIIMPWINNLSILNLAPEDRAAFYIEQLGTFVQNIKTINPNGRIIVLDYYFNKPQAFMEPISGGYKPENVKLFDSRIQAACSGGNLTQVTCLHSQDAFAGMEDRYLLSPMTRAEIEADLVPGETLNRASDYFKANPDGIVTGDNEHLSPAGKTAMAKFLTDHLEEFFKTQ